MTMSASFERTQSDFFGLLVNLSLETNEKLLGSCEVFIFGALDTVDSLSRGESEQVSQQGSDDVSKHSELDSRALELMARLLTKSSLPSVSQDRQLLIERLTTLVVFRCETIYDLLSAANKSTTPGAESQAKTDLSTDAACSEKSGESSQENSNSFNLEENELLLKRTRSLLRIALAVLQTPLFEDEKRTILDNQKGPLLFLIL